MNISSNRKNILAFPGIYSARSAGCTYKWLRSVNHLNGITQRIRHYIDEETKPEKRSHHMKPDNGPLPVGNKDYVSHQRHSFVRGFFIEQIQQRTGIAPHLMEPVDMLKQVDIIWKENLLNDRRKKDLAAMHTAVISLSPVYCKLLSDSGKDTDAYLLDIASKSMRHLEKQLLPMFSKREGKKLKQEDVKLAYLVGIHHDRQHIHAHLAVYPFTKRGDFVKIATDKKRGFDAYNAIRDFSRKYALEKFKKELYAPALMIEKGQDQIWQKNLVFAKAFHDTMQYTGRNTDAQLAGKLYQKAEDISALPDVQFHQKVSEAYDWAEGRFKDLKQTRISQGELDATKEGLDALKNEARGLTQDLTKSHTETTRLKEQMDETERQIARFDGDDFPPKTGDRQEDIDDGLFNSSFTDDDDDEQDKEFARIMGQMLDLITGKMHMTMMGLFKDMLRGAYKKAPPDDRRKLRAAVRPHSDSEPSEEQKEGRRMIKEKLMEKRDELQKALEQSEEKSFQTLDRLRIVSFRHTAGMMDLYLKQNIMSNTKPMLFSPQIKDILAESKNKGKHMEDIHTAMQKIRENDTALHNTPEILYSKLKKEPTLKDVVQIAPESEVAEKYSDIRKEVASLSL